MFDPINDLGSCRILLCNDDGYNAEGIKILEGIVSEISSDVWVVAPENEQSGMGHAITLQRPLRPRRLADKKYAVDGSPTDCILLALHHIMLDTPPDLIISGINMGPNLGDDVHYSGTIAAALEGVIQGIPSIAFSQLLGAGFSWETATYYIPKLIHSLCKTGWSSENIISVNFPNTRLDSVGGVRLAKQGRHKVSDKLILRNDPNGKPYVWHGKPRRCDLSDPAADATLLLEGYVSITALNINLTDFIAHKSLQILENI
jgi:5'-nucleotidase